MVSWALPTSHDGPHVSYQIRLHTSYEVLMISRMWNKEMMYRITATWYNFYILITTPSLIFNFIFLYTILLHRSPELFVQKYCISRVILFLVFGLASLHGD